MGHLKSIKMNKLDKDYQALLQDIIENGVNIINL
jgi:hypothetical protein